MKSTWDVGGGCADHGELPGLKIGKELMKRQPKMNERGIVWQPLIQNILDSVFGGSSGFGIPLREFPSHAKKACLCQNQQN